MGGVSCIGSRRFIYVCLRRKKLVKEYIYIYIRGRIYHIAYNGVERLSMEMIVKTDDRSSIAR